MASERRTFLLDNKIFLGLNQESPEGAAGRTIVRVKTKSLKDTHSLAHSFFTTYEPHLVIQELTRLMQVQGQQFQFSETSWKIFFDSQSSAKLNEADPSFNEQFRAQVEVLKVPDQDKFCVNFRRNAGSALLFKKKVYDIYMKELQLYNNTTLDV